MFDYFVSLGYRCVTARTTARYGLRAFAGPFDWLITENFDWVLHFVETDFLNFLQQDRLVPYGSHLKNFADKKTGFIFLHDQDDYKTEFASLKEKYDRRIKRFILAMHKRTCFLRYVANQKELDYIKVHAEYIQNVIGKYNQQNEIIFLVGKGIKVSEDIPFKVYNVAESYFAGFDEADDFLKFCGQNYSEGAAAIIRNLLSDDDKRIHLLERRYQTLIAMLPFDFSESVLPPEVIIYGAGILGQELYKKVQNYTRVKCFIDRSKYGKEFQGVPIISLDNLEPTEKTTIIVSTSYDFPTIKTSIQNKCVDVTVISLDDIIGLEF